MHAASFGLGPAQLGVWAAEEISAGADAFVISQVLWFDGDVEVGMLAQALVTAASDADVLELRLGSADDGTPVLLGGGRPPQVEVSDAVATDEQIRAGALGRCRSLGGDPDRFVARSVIHPRLGGGWAWEFAAHHLFLDAYGLGLFTRRVAQVYSALLDGVPVPPRWFGRYADVLVEMDGPAAMEAVDLERFWIDRFELARDERALVVDGSGRFFLTDARAGAGLGEDLVAAVDRVARAARVTWSDVMIAGWGLFTAARDGRRVVAVRMPQMNRRGRTALTTPAMLVGSAPVVLRPDPAQTVGGFVRRVHEVARDAAAHGGFDESLARCWPEGVEDYYSLPQVNVKAFDYEYRFGSVPGRQETIAGGPVGRLDLMVYRDRVHGFRLDLASSDPGVDAAAVTQVLADFVAWLAVFTADPDIRLAERPVLTSAEATRLAGWETGPRVPVAPVTLDDLLRRPAAASPDAVAVVAADGVSVSYRVLNDVMDRVAALLVGHGVRVADRVAVLLPRGVDLVAAVTGTIRAGAAYVPVDPAYPTDRVAAILEDSAAVAVLTDRATAAAHSDALIGSGVTVLPVEDHPSTFTTQPDAEYVVVPTLSRPLTPSDAAYVIFTSGTTGRPKGVVVNHQAIVNRLWWMRDDYGIGAADRVLLKTPAGFDVSVWEFFLPLVVGASVVVSTPHGHKDPEYLVDVIARRRITVMHFVPSMLQAFLGSGPDPAAVASLRRVFFSGEALPAGAAVAAADLFAGAGLHNLYGPTEAAVDVTAQQVLPVQLTGASMVPIGGPVANTSVVVLDPWLRRVGPGTAGELYLGGVQLADGYAGRGGLTSGRFVADPFATTGARLYRTGDVVRWNADGALEFLGRSDDQVKIRGFRIELDEVRGAVESHPAVTAAAVVACAHQAVGTYLAAYVAGDVSAEDAQQVLTAHVAGLVPEYMVPSVFVVLDALPVTVNGKLDRAALPAADLAHAAGHGRAPDTAMEIAIAEVIAEVLAVSGPVSVDDDFFALGGHSLLATRAVARLNTVLGAGLSLRDVFDRPTVAELADLIGQRAVASLPDVGSLPRPDVVPASFGQQSLWLIEQLGGPGGRYVVPTVVRLTGALDPDALADAVRDVIGRHEVLRTRLVADAGGLRQIVLDATDPGVAGAVVVEDLRASVDAAPARVDELVQARFELAVDVPVRAGLLRTGGREWVFVLAVHHHAVDEWSFPTVLGDLSTAYAARVAGAAPGWVPLPVQYADYAVWQRSVLGDVDDESSVLAGHLGYWRDQLVGSPAESTIALDRPRPEQPTFLGRDVEFTVDSEVTDGLRRVAERHGLSMFMVMQAATAVTASALGAGDDVVIGSPVGGRTQDGLAGLVGYFVNTLPIRHRLRPGDTLDAVLGRTRDAVLSAFEHQDAPFDQIAQAAGAARNRRRNPVFQIMLTHLVGDLHESLTLDGVTVTDEAVSISAVKTDIDLYITDDSTRLNGLLSYDTDLFDPATIERFATVFAEVLRMIAQDPDRSLAAVPTLAGGGRDRLADWGTGDSQVQEPGTLDDLLRHPAATSPQGVAVIAADGTPVSYRMLDAVTDRVATLLINHGVRVADRVAVLLPRGVDLVAAITGTIRAGAAYVPIDPAYPTDRVTAILRSSEAVVVITDRATAEQHAHAVAGVRVLTVEDHSRTFTVGSDGRAIGSPTLSRPLDGRDAASVIFTSGTTGRPKGVVVNHQALVNRLRWGADALELDATSVTLAKSGIGFVDASTELLGSLVTGATVLVVTDDVARDPAQLSLAIERYGVTHLLTVPSLASALLPHTAPASALSSLRHWVSSGEALSPATGSAMPAAAPRAVMHNFYGSTEVTGDATVARLDPPIGPVVPIGRPVPNTRVLVLDRWLRPVGPGAAGELYIGGVQLADGYAGQGALTAGRFVADPLSDGGDRLYRTGDVVRWSAVGALEFLGRSDDQVKIRGFRIELDEVRGAVESHPAVTAAAVVACAHPAGGTFLAAYVTGAVTADTAQRVLSAHVAGLVPEYMVPSVFIPLDRLPVTVHGKLDRTALPVPDLASAAGRGVAPSTAAEVAVAEVFAEVLALAGPVSADDDFFALGGHSLLATRVVARVNAVVGAGLSLRDVFDRPTVAGLADVIGRRVTAVGAVPAVGSVPRPDVVPVSFGQQSLWLIEQLGGPGGRYVVPTVVRLTGELDPGALMAAVRDVVGRHEALRTRLVPAGVHVGQVVVGADDPAVAGVVMVQDLRGGDEAQVRARVDELVQAGFDLAVDVPVRAGLLHTGGREWVFVLAVHHHAVDEWSFPTVLGDLSTAYAARVAGAAPGWVPLTVQYADYAVWQRSVLGDADDESSVLAGHLGYWRDQLAGAPAESSIAADRARPEVPSFHGADVEFTVDRALNDRLRAVADDLRVSMFMVVQAATAITVSVLGAGDDVVIGSPVGGRTQDGLAGVVGYFVNTLPIRHRLHPSDTLASVLVCV